MTSFFFKFSFSEVCPFVKARSWRLVKRVGVELCALSIFALEWRGFSFLAPLNCYLVHYGFKVDSSDKITRTSYYSEDSKSLLRIMLQFNLNMSLTSYQMQWLDCHDSIARSSFLIKAKCRIISTLAFSYTVGMTCLTGWLRSWQRRKFTYCISDQGPNLRNEKRGTSMRLI